MQANSIIFQSKLLPHRITSNRFQLHKCHFTKQTVGIKEHYRTKLHMDSNLIYYLENKQYGLSSVVFQLCTSTKYPVF